MPSRLLNWAAPGLLSLRILAYPEAARYLEDESYLLTYSVSEEGEGD